MKIESKQLVCMACKEVLDDITLASVEKGQGEKISACVVMTMVCSSCNRSWRQTIITEEV